MSWKIIVLIGLTSLVQFASASANKRYLVRFKTERLYAQFANRMKAVWSPGVRALSEGALSGRSLDQIKTLVVSTNDSEMIENLRAHPAVALVEEEVFHPAPQIMSTGLPSSIAAMDFKMDRPWGIDAVRAPEAWAITEGAGARAMVLDTGIDTGHPAIAANFEKGRNFTGDNASDFSDKEGHGTHVSGTMVASGLNGGLVGVAPKARLLMGKVCDTRGCSSVAIAEGLDWAVVEHVDVVNLSLGGLYMTAGEAMALLEAEDAGVFVAAASGNDGKNYVSYPGAAGTVLAVGAVDQNLKRAVFSQYGPELGIVGPGVETISSVPRGTGRISVVQLALDGEALKTIASTAFVGSPAGAVSGQEMVAVGLGEVADFAAVNVHGKIALIQRGIIPFKDKVNNAINAGASAALIYNNVAGMMQGSIADEATEAKIPAFMIEQSLGELISAALKNNRPVRVEAAVERTDYAAFEGTSMATPHVAAVATLVRAANPRLTPAQVRFVLKSTATPLGPNDQNQCGSGLVNAEAAVKRARAMIVSGSSLARK